MSAKNCWNDRGRFTLGELAHVVAGQLGDQWVQLEQEGQGLADTTSSTEHGNLEVALD